MSRMPFVYRASHDGWSRANAGKRRGLQATKPRSYSSVRHGDWRLLVMMNGFRLRSGVCRAMVTFFLGVVLLSLILPAPMAHALLDEQTRDDGLADATGASPNTQGRGSVG